MNARKIAFSLSLAFTLAAVACSGGNGGGDAEVPDIADTPAPPAAATSEPDPTPAPSPTPLPRPTATATPEGMSDTESVGGYIRAHNLLNRGEYREAERQFNTVVEIEPGFAHAWSGIGQSLLLQREYEDSLYYFDKAIELRPNLADTYAFRAMARVSLSDPEGAERDALHSLRLNGDLIDPYIVLGRVYANYGDRVAALVAFDTAVERAPDDGGTYWWRGRFLRDVNGDFDASLADFDRAVELEPAIATIYLDRAILRFQSGIDLPLIRADLEEAISLSKEPRLPEIIERAEELLEQVTDIETRLSER